MNENSEAARGSRRHKNALREEWESDKSLFFADVPSLLAMVMAAGSSVVFAYSIVTE